MLWFNKLGTAAAIVLAITLIGGTGIYLSVARAGTAAPPPVTVPVPTAASTKAPAALNAMASQSAPATKQKGIHFAKGPDNGEALVAARMKGPPGPLAAGIGDPAILKIGPALPFWRIDLKDVAAGGGLEKAFFYDPANAQHMYHYLLENGGKGVGSADVLVDTAAGTAKLTGFSGTNDSDSIVQGLKKLSELPEVKNGSFEARYLNSGAVFGSGPTLVVWLKADDGGKDFIYTCTNGRVSPKLEAEKIYTAEDYLNIIRPLAAQRAGNAGGAPATSHP